jgi:hypothetical protein
MAGSVVAHIRNHRWLWIALSAVAAAAAWLARSSLGAGYHFGDIMALALMVVGTLLILQSQEGYNPPRMEI